MSAASDDQRRSPQRPRRHRLDDLLGMRVWFSDGSSGDQVTDVRLVPGDRVRGQLDELVTEGLVIGRRRPGTLFGYDRHPHQGPWLVGVIIRFLHRHTGYVEWSDIRHIDWDTGRIDLTLAALRDLQPHGEPPSAATRPE